MRETFEMVIRWASLILGLLVIGSCAVAGGMEGGALGAVGGLFGGAIIALFLLGWIYVYFILRSDLKSIRDEIAKLRSGERADP